MRWEPASGRVQSDQLTVFSTELEIGDELAVVESEQCPASSIPELENDGERVVEESEQYPASSIPAPEIGGEQVAEESEQYLASS